LTISCLHRYQTMFEVDVEHVQYALHLLLLN